MVKGTADTRFLHDADAITIEYGATGAVTRRYVHGTSASADDPLLQYDGAGLTSRRSLEADERGSIIRIANSNGATVATNRYDEYGAPASTNSGRFQYTGQAWIPELGLYYYKARFYSPALGRFMQVDPIGYEGGINLYAYAGNDPVNFVDPDGTQPESVMDRRNQALIQTTEECEGQGPACAATIGEGIGVAAAAASIFAPAPGVLIRGIPWLGRVLGFGTRSRTVTISNKQLGPKFASHHREWGLKPGEYERFRSIITSIADKPDRVVKGFMSGGSDRGRRAVQFFVKGRDVVVTDRNGRFVTVLKNGLDNQNVQKALRVTCTGARTTSTMC